MAGETKGTEVKGFENEMYCPMGNDVNKPISGKDILTCIFNSTGEKLLAVGGQQKTDTDMTADTHDVNTKTNGGWKEAVYGLKGWEKKLDGAVIMNDESHKILKKAFADGEILCIKDVNVKTKKAVEGGLALITNYSTSASYDDSMTYSITLKGTGPLTDLTNLGETVDVDKMPEGVGE